MFKTISNDNHVEQGKKNSNLKLQELKSNFEFGNQYSNNNFFTTNNCYLNKKDLRNNKFDTSRIPYLKPNYSGFEIKGETAKTHFLTSTQRDFNTKKLEKKLKQIYHRENSDVIVIFLILDSSSNKANFNRYSNFQTFQQYHY